MGYKASINGQRILGVDLAKIVAMVFVVALHVDGGGLKCLASDGMVGGGLLIVRSMFHALFTTCIDLFAIISGYVCVYAQFRVSRIINLWLQVVFTCTIVSFATSAALNINLTYSQWVRCLLPISGRQYWYMTAYFMLAFTMPFLNVGLRAMRRRTVEFIIFTMLAIVGIMSLSGIKGAFGVEAGFSFEWLLLLYLLGGYLRMYRPLHGANRLCLTLTLALLIVVNGSAIIVVPEPLFYIGYISPTSVLASVCIFELLLSVKVRSKRVEAAVRWFANLSLGVYLLHNTPVFWSNVFKPAIISVNVTSVATWALYLVGFVAVFYGCGTLFDAIREKLFRLARVYECTKWIDGALGKFISRGA